MGEWKTRGTPAPHWIDVEVRDDECPPSWRASLRFDGCVHLNRYFNGFDPDSKTGPSSKDNDTDYMHICDLDELIELLQQLKSEALEHFGKDWPA